MFSNINGLIKPTILDVKKWTFSERIHRILSIKRSKQLSITPTHIWNWTLTNLCLFLFLLAKFPVPRTTLQVSASLLIQKRGYNGVWCVREKKYWGNRTILNNLPDNFNNFLYTLILIVNTTFHSSGLTYPFFSCFSQHLEHRNPPCLWRSIKWFCGSVIPCSSSHSVCRSFSDFK